MLAEAATVADGKLYVHGGGWSRLVVDRVPTTHPSMSLVFVLELDGSESAGSMTLDFDFMLGGLAVASVRGWIEVPPAPPSDAPAALITNQFTFTNLPLPDAGTYELRIAAGGERLGGLDLHVEQIPHPT